MKKNNTIDLQHPHRQSYVAILMIIWKTYRIIFGQIWPIFILFIIGRSGKAQYGLIYGISAVAVLGMIYSIINYFRYYFYINQKELIVEKGVFKRKKINVPFERIQTINFEQNIAHRLFRVVRLNIETAGTSKSEFEFQAVDIQVANQLRDTILTSKKVSKKTSDEAHDLNIPLDTYQTILKLDLGDLIKAGIVENHLKSGGIIIAFLFWVWQSLEDLNLDDRIDTDRMTSFFSDMLFFGIIIGLFFVLSFFISLIRMVLLHYNLSFKRSSKGFKIQGGLITRKDTSALNHKIQVVSWSDNLLKKIFHIKDLKLKQASSIEVDQKQSITIPSCKQSHIDQVLKSLYGVQALNNIQLQKISPKYLIRRNLILSLVFAIPIVALTYFDQYRQLTAATVIYILLFIYNYLSYKKKSFGYNHHMLMIKSGSYGDQMTVLPIYKIQSVAKSQTPYQRRNQLANLIVTTASGKLRIPYIPNQKVDQMINFFLMLIETNRKPWM